MKLASLNPSSLTKALRQGLFLRTGAFVIHLKTSIPSVVNGLRLLYADYPLVSDEFADFHVTLAAPRNVRRWLRSQVLFKFEGMTPFKPLPYSQAFPMLEWGMNWCVSNHANDYLIIHAAVVEKNGRAVILPAPPGSGKSTLTAALVNRGWRLLSDELTLIRLADGKVEPLPRPVSLKNASIDVIKRFAPDAVFSPEVRDTVKGTVAHMKPSLDSIERAAEAVFAHWIIFPRYEAGAATRLEAITPARGFMRVADNAFNYGLLGQQGFTALADVVDRVLFFDFSYSVLDEAMLAFDALPVRS